MRMCLLVCFSASLYAQAQEANAGFEVATTLSGDAFYSHELTEPPRSGGSIDGGFRAMVYPTFKLSEHWAIAGAIQASSRPYFFEQYATQGHGVNADILQAHVTYSRFWGNKSIAIRAGQLSSAFGAFLLRYDDAVNPLIDLPMAYGYYYKPVTTLGLAGVQADVTLGKLDMRAQFVNSSPANPRSVFDADQYGNWAGGVGYTIRQGFRVGVSAYRGPYLDRHYAYYFPGEAKPRDLPGTGYGIDVQWGHGPWNVYGELQRFQFAYRAIPTFNEHTGYAEVRRVLHPRWYLAARASYLRQVGFSGEQVYETVVGYRPNRFQLLKVGYQIHQGTDVRGTLDNYLAIQLVTTLQPISVAHD